MTHEHATRARRSRTLRMGAIVLSAAAIGAGGALAVDAVRDDATTPAPALTAPAATTSATTVALPTASATDFSAVYAARSGGVVSILAGTAGGSSDADGPMAPTPGGQQAAQGSGVVVDADGHILTNEHVVSGATAVRVTFAAGATLDARVVGTDPSTDLALLRVDAPDGVLMPVPLGDSSALRIGEPVLAVGDPFGQRGSASAGIVSGLGRSIVSPNGFSVPDAIQTDAAINRGNSGGALLNGEGELVGVPAQIADSGVAGNVGVAFAIPVDTAKRVIAALKEDGQVDHAWLGVSTTGVDEALRGVDGVGAERGAMITGLAQGGPADAAGLTAGDRVMGSVAGPVCTGGDVITAVDGTAVEDAAGLQRAVEAASPGDSVRLTVVDGDGDERTVDVTLRERPDTVPATRMGCQG